MVSHAVAGQGSEARMNRTEAETVALDALSWIAATDDLLGVFLGASGLSADDLPRLAGQRSTLVAVLDFLVMDDAWVVGFCDDRGLSYDTPLRARTVLAGRREMHWT